MDFFERQAKAHHNTKLLVIYFTAGVAMLVVTIYFAALLIFAGINSRHSRYVRYDNERPTVDLWNPRLFLGVAVGTLAVVALGSLFKTAELAQGGSVVATNLGGRLVNPATTNPDERKLLNVVEEMAIAAGIPVPQVYILPDERGINAFAAGHSTSDAVVAATEGAIKLLTRDELQGVMGHEFSHILNGDMQLNLRLMGIIFGIVCLTVIGRILLQTRSRDRNPLPLFGLALIVLGGVGVLFGRLIQSAVSRQREFLADASSVQFTRNPAGLAGALKKIGGLSYGSKLETAHATEASHMFFGNGMGESFLHLMDTHPPLSDRIRAIDPSFDGTFPLVSSVGVDSWGGDQEPFSGISPGLAALAGQSASKPPPLPRSVIPHAVLPSIANPTTMHLRYAETLRGTIPPALQTAARDPLGASALIYALLLSDDETIRKRQLDELTQATSASVTNETVRLWPETRDVATHAHLPLVDLALPGLRHLSPSQFQQFRAAVQKLVESDGEIDLFEYVLQKIVLRHLEPYYGQPRKPVMQYYALKPLAHDCEVLLSALAYLGQDEPAAIQRAFEQGAQPLSYAAQVGLGLQPPDQSDLQQVDAALNRLVLAVPQIKKNVLSACAQTVGADGVIQESEAELLRAIADTVDCPMPPFVTQS
jgi:Zn-dependent protease with chaperone function